MAKPALALLLPLLLAACATTPPLDTTGASTHLRPYQIDGHAAAHGETVVWGGMIVEVRNFADRSEIELLAYPLDARQRPRLEQPAEGRFVAVLPGFADPLLFPQGRFMTLRGQLGIPAEAAGGPSGERYPRVAVEATHVWPRGFRNSGPRIGIGIGIAL